MEIGPVKHGGQMQPSEKKQTQTTQETPQEAPRDRVEISEDARKKLAQLADEALRKLQAEKPPAKDTSVPTEESGRESGTVVEPGDASISEPAGDAKLAEVRRRIDAGFYERPDVKQNIADKLADEMES